MDLMPPNNTQNLERAIEAIARAIVSGTPAFNSNKYKFRVSKTSAQNTVAGAFTKVLLNSVTFDTAPGFDATTNYRYVAQVSGYYYFVGRVQMGVANSTILIPSLYKNGAEHTRGIDHRVLAASRGAGVSDIIYLAANDYVELQVFCDVAIAMDVTATHLNHLSGFLVSQL